MTEKRALQVNVDGVPLGEAEGRALWERFSAHMDTHRGDLRGFAEAEGFASVHPTVGPDGPVLMVSRSAPQGPYVHAPRVSSPPPGAVKAKPGAGSQRRR